MNQVCTCVIHSQVTSECESGGMCKSGSNKSAEIVSAMPGKGIQAPTPMELLIASLLHCVSMSLMEGARSSGCEVKKVLSSASFTADLEHGLKAVEATYIIDGGLSAKEAKILLKEAEAFSPVLKSISSFTKYESSVQVM